MTARVDRVRSGRRTVIIAGLACAAVIAFAVSCTIRLLPRIVTALAFRDAERLDREFAAGAARSTENDVNAAEKRLEQEYGELFRRGYFDHEHWLARVPAAGFTPEALPAYLVLWAYKEAWDDSAATADADRLVEETVRWVRPLFASAHAKEAMVNVLLRDVEIEPGKVEDGGFVKRLLFECLTLRDPDDYGWGNDSEPDLEASAARVFPALGEGAWESTLRHSGDPRETVRAGSLLLLCHHPQRAVFEARAREALADPAELVRIAAAGTLAYHRLADGEVVLISGLAHERWAVRWWCGKSLTYLGGGRARSALEAVKKGEVDAWVRRQMSSMISAME